MPIERRPHRGRHRHGRRRYGRQRRHWRREQGPFALSSAHPQERVRLVGIRAGRRLVRRLADLGLTPGTEVTVWRVAGPVIVMLHRCRIVLGRGAARAVIVESTEETA
jgi:Fe2+ transport system protein FeoA